MSSYIDMIFENTLEFLSLQENVGDSLIYSDVKSLGYWLIEILSVDLDIAAKIVSEYNISQKTKDSIDAGTKITDEPSNKSTVYKRLLELSPAFHLFSENDWDILWRDFIKNDRKQSSASIGKNSILLFLQASYSNPALFDLSFLKYLIQAGFFLPVCWQLSLPTECQAPFPNIKNLSPVLSRASIDLNKSFSEFQQLAKPPIQYYYEKISQLRFHMISVISLLELSRQHKTIRRCANCGRYFIPKNRVDTIYCDNTSPQDPSRTCQKYGTDRLWYDRQKDDELATLSRNILSAKGLLAKRHQDIIEYSIAYDYFRNERKKWKDAVKHGLKSREEYREWLLSMQRQKVIKEAKNGPH